jgi:hypothetical protein
LLRTLKNHGPRPVGHLLNDRRLATIVQARPARACPPPPYTLPKPCDEMHATQFDPEPVFVAVSGPVFARLRAGSHVRRHHVRIILSHVLPNVFGAILIPATVRLRTAILAEATSSFLGYGVPPRYPAWGAVLSGTVGRICSGRPGCPSGWGWRSAWLSSASTCSVTRCETSWIRG